MCRLVAYIGKKSILLNELLDKPENSLINQSHHAKTGTHGVNADGFGLAWYDQEIDHIPGVFKSTRPAWNDNNLQHISDKIKSNCFLGHIRASTIGEVTLNNCHPFTYQQYSLVHNGTIRQFSTIRRDLINQLDDEIFEQLKAQTDSEHLFCLIMQFLKTAPDKGLEDAVFKAFNWVQTSQEALSEEHFSRLNIVITDGYEIIATRFSTKNNDSLSLHYVLSSSNEILETTEETTNNSIVIASEPLTDYLQHWDEVPHNHYLVARNSDFNISIKPFEF